MNGPTGTCDPECFAVSFGALPMPPGYSVWWHAEHEHYQGHAPNGEESDIHADRFACRRWCCKKRQGGDMTDDERRAHILRAIELARPAPGAKPDPETLRRLLTRLWEHP